MANSKLPSWYFNYGYHVLNEGQLDELIQYLNNTDVLKRLVAVLNTLGNHDKTHIEIEPIDDSDSMKYLEIELDEDDKLDPKVYVNLIDEQMELGGIDIDIAGTILNNAFDYGTFGGTDEESFAALFGAIHKHALDNNLNVDIIIKALDRYYSRHNTSGYDNLKDAIEGEFSGDEEVVALLLARQQVDPSILRGLNIYTILGDVGLMLLSFGGWGAALGAKTGVAATRIGKTAARASSAIEATKIGRITSKAFAPIKKIVKSRWLRLNGEAKYKALKKAGYDIGSKVKWKSSSGKLIEGEITKIVPEKSQIFIKFKGAKNEMPFYINKLIDKLGIEEATKVAYAAGIIDKMDPKLLYAAGLGAQHIESSSSGGSNYLEQGAELLGWYDSTRANPNEKMKEYKNTDPIDLVKAIHDNVDGWTSDEEELALAMMILSLNRESAIAINDAWNRLYQNEGSFIERVIKEELDDDIALMVGCYWTALVGGNTEYARMIENMLNRILQK